MDDDELETLMVTSTIMILLCFAWIKEAESVMMAYVHGVESSGVNSVDAYIKFKKLLGIN